MTDKTGGYKSLAGWEDPEVWQFMTVWYSSPTSPDFFRLFDAHVWNQFSSNSASVCMSLKMVRELLPLSQLTQYHAPLLPWSFRNQCCLSLSDQKPANLQRSACPNLSLCIQIINSLDPFHLRWGKVGGAGNAASSILSCFVPSKV